MKTGVLDSESSYLLLVNSINDYAIFMLNPGGFVASWNPGAERFKGYRPDEIIGKHFSCFYPPEAVRRGLHEKELKAAATDGKFESEGWRVRKNGKKFWANVIISALRDEKGKLLGFSKVTRDLTVRKAHEQEIARMSRLYSALAQVNQAIVRTNDRDEMFHKICRALVEFGGFHMAWIGWLNAETRQTRPVAQWGDTTNYLAQVTIYADDNRPEGRGPTGLAIREGRNYICNDFFRDPVTLPWREKAAMASFRASAAFPIRQGGVVCGALTVYSDEIGFFQDKEIALLEEAAGDVSFALDNFACVAAHQQAEQLVRQERELLRALLDNSPDNIYFKDRQSHFVRINEALARRFKLGNPAEAIGKTDFDMFGESHARQAYEDEQRIMETGGPMVGVEEKETWPDGSVTWVSTTKIPLRDEEGGITGLVGISRDITANKNLEEQIRQMQKMEAIGQLAGGVAHDFNNIMAVVQMQIDLLKTGADVTPAQLEAAEDIVKAVQRAKALTRQLLMFGRKQTPQPRDLDLNNSINDMTKMLRRTLGEDIQLQFKFAMQPLFVRADAGMMDQVLMNLAVNARDAMSKGGRLVIETSAADFDESVRVKSAQSRPGSFVCLSVSDTGCGIPPENLQHIFEPFFTTKEVGKGTGLGLATVFGIVQQHQGWINVYSEVGHGTTFRIYLPRLAGMAGQKTEPTALPAMRGGDETILFVEDDAPLRAVVRQILSKLGYRVFEADNGIEALEIWKQHRDEIHLLLTDMVMPGGINGIELAEELLKENPQLKIIYASGYSAEVAGKDFPLKEGVNFLAKPFVAHKLAQTIRNLLD